MTKNDFGKIQQSHENYLSEALKNKEIEWPDTVDFTNFQEILRAAGVTTFESKLKDLFESRKEEVGDSIQLTIDKVVKIAIENNMFGINESFGQTEVEEIEGA